MPESRPGSVDVRRRRRWSFAGCVFNEGNWTLVVDGRRIPIETKPLELLRELLLHAGSVVTKDELLDRIWSGVTVVEASLPTAVRKLRLALNDEDREPQIIETVPRVGYRLGVPVDVEDQTMPAAAPVETGRQSGFSPRSGRMPLILALAAGLAVASAMIGFGLAGVRQPTGTAPLPKVYSQRDAADALRKLDVATIEAMLRSGWDPNRPFDDQGNGALNVLFNICEWDPAHDQRRMLLVARTLMDGGARLDQRNVWGDTPYSIAKANRYCGPDHPVTRMIRTLCYAGYKPLGDKCLPSYELARRGRKAS